jgi:hypothetical protein
MSRRGRAISVILITHRNAAGLHPGIDLRADPAIPAAHDEPRGAAAPESAHTGPLADEGGPG